jgi:hypothetical protein
MRLLVPLIFTFVISSLSFAPTVSARDQADSASNRYEQRKLYQELLQAIKTNQRSKYNAQKDKLIGYPLYPYLEYTDKIYRISRNPKPTSKALLANMRTHP